MEGEIAIIIANSVFDQKFWGTSIFLIVDVLETIVAHVSDEWADFKEVEWGEVIVIRPLGIYVEFTWNLLDSKLWLHINLQFQFF